MALILGIHVDSNGCAAALADGVNILASDSASAQRGANEKLMPMIAKVLSDGKKTLNDIDWIAANVGPGSFTGIRVCLSAAHGLSIGSGKPIFGVPHLSALAAAIPKNLTAGKGIFAVELSGKGDFHVAAYGDDLKPILPPVRAGDFFTYMPPQDRTWIMIGDAANDAKQALGHGEVMQKNDANLAEAVCRFAAINLNDAAQYPASPLYFRDADVTLRAPD